MNGSNISPEEEDLIIRLHKLLGDRWSLIAGRLPGRTPNEVKSYWKARTEASRAETRAITREDMTCEVSSRKIFRPKAMKYTKLNLLQPDNQMPSK